MQHQQIKDRRMNSQQVVTKQNQNQDKARVQMKRIDESSRSACAFESIERLTMFQRPVHRNKKRKSTALGKFNCAFYSS